MPEEKRKYRILNVTDSVRVLPDGKKEEVKVVTYSTPEGRILSVTIPKEKYNEKAIKEAIAEQEKARPEEIGKVFEI